MGLVTALSDQIHGTYPVAQFYIRFLKQGATAGSGLVIYTIYHNRSFAGTKKIMVSSAEACTSMHGTAGKAQKAVSSITGMKVTVVQCELPK